MEIKSSDLMSEMYKIIREDFPDMTFAHFKEIVRAPWMMLNESMQSEEYSPVRFHFFGLFSCTPGNTNRCEKMSVRAFSKSQISETEYERINTKIKNINEYNSKTEKEEDISE